MDELYLHTGDADIAVAEHTTDADLAIDPDLLAEIPPLEQSLEEAGFVHMGGRGVGVLRILQAVSTDDLARSIKRILSDDRSAVVGQKSLQLLRELFGGHRSEGAVMAARATQPLMDEDEVRISCEVLAKDLLGELES